MFDSVDGFGLMVCDSYIYKKTVKGKKEKTHEKREILINSTEMYICTGAYIYRINYDNKCNPFPTFA